MTLKLKRMIIKQLERKGQIINFLQLLEREERLPSLPHQSKTHRFSSSKHRRSLFKRSQEIVELLIFLNNHFLNRTHHVFKLLVVVTNIKSCYSSIVLLVFLKLNSLIQLDCSNSIDLQLYCPFHLLQK